jgi:beta-xylosidase
MEQKFTLQKIKLGEKHRTVRDLNTVVESLLHQNFCLANTIKQLVKEWPTLATVDLDTIDAALSKYGISLETKDSTST